MRLETPRERREGAAELPVQGQWSMGGATELQVDGWWQTGRADRGRAAAVAILDLGR
jgi:hypothetical protein